MRRHPPISIDRLREALDYDHESGQFRWRIRTGSRVRIGDIAGFIDDTGTVVIGLDERVVVAHRAAWAYVYGEWPKKPVKPKDGNKTNCAIANLYLGKHMNRYSKKRA